MDAPARPNSDRPEKTTYELACVKCRNRKIKCSRVHPCNNCSESGSDCVFPSRRVRRKQETAKRVRTRDDELLRRISHLEGVIQRLAPSPDSEDSKTAGEEPSTESSTKALPSASGSDDAAADPHRDDGSARKYVQHVKQQNKTYRRLTGTFWTSLSQEFDGLRQVLEQSAEDDNEEGFPFCGLGNEMSKYYPPQHHRRILLETYWRNVHGTFGLYHKPVNDARMAAFASYASRETGRLVYAGMECLLFSQILAAVVSMTPEECFTLFEESRDGMISKYKIATEEALIHADFLNNRELNIVQTLALYIAILGCTRFASGAWALTGLCVTLARSAGLDRDGQGLVYSPYQRELRRKLWWHIIVLDFRTTAARSIASMITSDSFNTPRFANINDADYALNTEQDLHDSVGITDVTLSLMIADFSNIARDVMYPNSSADINREVQQQEVTIRVNEFHDRIEQVYLNGCTGNDPGTWSHLHDTDYGWSKHIWPRERRLMMATEHLKIVALLDDSVLARPFWWSLELKIPVHPIAVVLVEVGSRSTGPTVDQAWNIIQSRWHIWEARAADTSPTVFWRPLQKLHRRAQAAREAMEAETVKHQPDLHWTSPEQVSSSSYGSSQPYAFDTNATPWRSDDAMLVDNDNTSLSSNPMIGSDLVDIHHWQDVSWEGMLNSSSRHLSFSSQDLSPLDTTVADQQLFDVFDWTTDWSQVPINFDLNGSTMPSMTPLTMHSTDWSFQGV